MRARHIRFVALISLLALIVASCGGGNGEEGADPTEAPTATTEAPTATTEAPTATTEPPTVTTEASSTTAGASSDVIELELSAIDNEGFNRNQFTIVAGAEVILTFVNKDDGGDPHNVHVRTDTDDWFTELKEGPDTQSITFTIGTPGEYEFFCDTHAETMKGTLIVEAP